MKLGANKTQGIVAASAAVLLLLLSASAFGYTSGSHPAGTHVTPNGDGNQTPGSGSQPGDNQDEDHGNTTTTTTSASHTETKSTSHGQSGETEQEKSGDNGQSGRNGTSQMNQREADGSHELKFALVPAGASSPGQGEASIDISGLLLQVQASIEGASPATQYTLSISTNGSTHTVGTLTTDEEGDGEIQAQFNATKAGTYAIGVSILQGAAIALSSAPLSETATLSQNGSDDVGDQDQNEEGDNVNEVQENQHDEQQIAHAEDDKTIPAVVQVTGSSVTTSVTDPRFSVSVGKLEGNGLVIQISGNNVTGSRVLLVNLSSSVDLTSHSLVVTLDGNRIAQASSIAQVLSSSPADPARYIVVGTSTGTQLLVSIPHFSVHTIRLLPSSLPQSFFAANGTYLLATVIALSAAFAAAYASRKRIFSILA